MEEMGLSRAELEEIERAILEEEKQPLSEELKKLVSDIILEYKKSGSITTSQLLNSWTSSRRRRANLKKFTGR